MAQKTKIEKAGAIFKTAADETKKLRKKINLDEKELLNVLKENFELLISLWHPHHPFLLCKSVHKSFLYLASLLHKTTRIVANLLTIPFFH